MKIADELFKELGLEVFDEGGTLGEVVRVSEIKKRLDGPGDTIMGMVVRRKGCGHSYSQPILFSSELLQDGIALSTYLIMLKFNIQTETDARKCEVCEAKRERENI